MGNSQGMGEWGEEAGEKLKGKQSWSPEVPVTPSLGCFSQTPLRVLFKQSSWGGLYWADSPCQEILGAEEGLTLLSVSFLEEARGTAPPGNPVLCPFFLRFLPHWLPQRCQASLSSREG